jgi:type II secretory pathway component GspD/PulD (secretin)/tetratricopeptide (TPR) repeat protein
VFDSEKIDMRIDRHHRNRRTLSALSLIGAAAALTLSPAGALAQVAGSAPANPVDAAPAAAGLEMLANARTLHEQGQFVQAKALLEQLFRSTEIDRLPDLERAQAMQLVKANDSKITTADPIEISLQKADWAIQCGDLVEAERHAGAVAKKSSATKAQRERAKLATTTIEDRRTAISPAIPGRIEQAKADFEAQRYAEAKASILEVLRSGVKLSPEQSASLERQQLAIVDLENSTGHRFETASAASLGLTQQPGVVRRPKKPGEPGHAEPLPPSMNDQVAEPPAPAAEPAQPAPAVAQPADTQPPAEPAPAAAPMDTQPAAQVAPASSSGSQDELLTQAMRAQAYSIVTEGDLAFDRANYSTALDKYTLALGQFRSYLKAEDADRVQKRIDECRVRQGASLGGRDLAQSTVGTENAIRGRARAEFDTGVKEAETALDGGRPEDALGNYANAQLAISKARAYFNAAELDVFNKRLDTLKAAIDAKQRQAIEEARLKQEKLAQDTATTLEQNRLSERDRKVEENVKRIRALQAEQKYDEALQIVDQTLFMDPLNPTALLLRDLLRDMAVFKKYQDMQQLKTFNAGQRQLDDQAAMIVPAHMMDFPLDWPTKTWQRGETAAYAESPENRAVLAKMDTTKIPLDLTDNRFEDVLKFVSQVTQLPIDVDWESLSNVGVNKDSEVTLKMQSKLSVKNALERVLNKVSKDINAKAGWAVENGVINVASEETLKKNKVLVIYNIQDLLFTIPNHRQVPQIDLNNVLQSNGGGGGGGGQSPFSNTNDNNQNQQDDPAVRERRTRQILDIIEANVDPDGWQDRGGDTGTVQELNGSLIITNTPRNHREIVGLLSKLREIRNMQINVETKFLLVNQSWFEQIGFDIDLVFNANSSQVTRARTADPSLQPIDFFNFGSTSGSVQGAVRQVTGQGSTTVPGTLTPQSIAVTNPANLSPIGTLGNSLGLTTTLAEGDFASTVLKQAPALGIAGQFLDDIQVNFLIVATQADKRSVRLTAPRLTFTNGQTANIYVATQQAFISQLNPIVGNSAVGFNPTTAVLSEGVTMLVEGVISSDRRYVTMNIDSGVSRIDSIRQSPVTAVAGGQLVNSASTQSFIELPQVTVTRVRTTSTVPDEGTLLIGGQRLITEVEVETGVPVLSKIPILNRFFTNRMETKEEQSLLVLIKPTIIIQTEEEERAYPGVNDQVRSGLGLR